LSTRFRGLNRVSRRASEFFSLFPLTRRSFPLLDLPLVPLGSSGEASLCALSHGFAADIGLDGDVFLVQPRSPIVSFSSPSCPSPLFPRHSPSCPSEEPRLFQESMCVRRRVLCLAALYSPGMFFFFPPFFLGSSFSEISDSFSRGVPPADSSCGNSLCEDSSGEDLAVVPHSI